MKNGVIHPNINAQTHGEVPSDRSNVHPDVQAAHSSTAAGNENGAVYATLDWQTGQGRSRQQTTQATYHAEASAATDHVNDGTSITPNSSGTYNGSVTDGTEINGTQTSYDPRYSDYGSNSSSVSTYGYNGNSADRSYYGANSDVQSSINTSSNLPFDSNYSSLPVNVSGSNWNDFSVLLNNHSDFSDFNQQPPNFWHEVQQLSQTPIFETAENQLPELSKYENLVNQMEARNLSLDDFAKTLPPPEREVFSARVQIDQTFGTDIFERDGVTLNANGQNRLREAFENGEIDLPPNFRSELFTGKSAPVAENGLPTTREIAVIEAKKDRSEFGSTAEFGRPIITPDSLKKLETGDLKSPDKTAQIAAATVNNNNGSTFLPENGAARTANSGSALSDNSANIGAVTRREGGTATVGGALVGNSLNANNNYKNSESSEINKSRSLNNYNANGGKSFAAGATGAMMSAAIGSLISDSKSHVGGAVGFVSGVFVGAEADQGVRWLSADKNISVAAADSFKSLPEKPFALNADLQLA